MFSYKSILTLCQLINNFVQQLLNFLNRKLFRFKEISGDIFHSIVYSNVYREKNRCIFKIICKIVIFNKIFIKNLNSCKKFINLIHYLMRFNSYQ